MVNDQVGVLRDHHWYIHLVQNMEVRDNPLVRCQVENLRVQHG